MLQALAPHLPIAPPQSLYLAITQLQHGSCIFQFQCPTVDSPHYPHPLQLTAAHARPHSTRPPVAGGLSLRGYFYSVREGTLSKSFNTLMLTVTPPIEFACLRSSCGFCFLLGSCFCRRLGALAGTV